MLKCAELEPISLAHGCTAGEPLAVLLNSRRQHVAIASAASEIAVGVVLLLRFLG